jgi:hypothetical protein
LRGRLDLRNAETGLLALLSLCVTSCGSSDPSPTFASAFQEVARVELEERPDTPIVGIASIQPRPGGGFAIADEASDLVWLFDASGRIDRVMGGRGDGPGELDAPTAAVELEDGRVLVTQRSNSRMTQFHAEGDPTLLSVPGRYGFWASPLGAELVVGVGTRDTRYAILAEDGTERARFGRLAPIVNNTPFWIFLARDHATVVDKRVVTNTSFFPRLRVYDEHGDSIATIGTAPPSWVAPTAPPIDRVEGPADRALLDEWTRSFSVVRNVATIDRELVVVQYGRYNPSTTDSYRVDPTTIDVYRLDGTKLVEDLALPYPVVGGGERLLVVTAEPPEPWTVAVYRWTGGG